MAEEGGLEMNILFWVAILLIACWLAFNATKHKRDDKQDMSASAVPPRDAKHTEGRSPHAIEDREIVRAKAAASRVAEQERATSAAHEKEQKSVRDKIARARKIIEEAGLDHALPSLWDRVQYWGSWSQMPDRWTAPAGISDISGSKEDGTEHVRWSWQGNEFELIHRKKHNYTPDGDYDPAELGLSYNGQTVNRHSMPAHLR